MSDTVTIILILAVLIGVAWLVYVLRHKLKNADVSACGVTAKIGTHEPDKLAVKNIVQLSEQADNRVDIHSNNATVDGVKQTAKKGNVLNIRN